MTEAAETVFFNGSLDNLSRFINNCEINLTSMTPAQIIDEVYRVTNVRQKVKNYQMVANLNKLKELTRNLSRQETIRYDAFLSWLRGMIVSHKEEPLADIPSELQNKVVTLITIHKAKGLEYDHVILPELDNEYNQFILRPPVIYNKETGLEISYRSYYDRYITKSSDNYTSTIEAFKKDLYSEELRVLYVALTRAKEKLIFVGSEGCPNSRMCFQNWLMA
jgi:DNA helicase-2/ATP-dependent DNA helicase PcrA